LRFEIVLPTRAQRRSLPVINCQILKELRL
jgi:hypothetical protein